MPVTSSSVKKTAPKIDATINVMSPIAFAQPWMNAPFRLRLRFVRRILELRVHRLRDLHRLRGVLDQDRVPAHLAFARAPVLIEIIVTEEKPASCPCVCPRCQRCRRCQTSTSGLPLAVTQIGDINGILSPTFHPKRSAFSFPTTAPVRVSSPRLHLFLGQLQLRVRLQEILRHNRVLHEKILRVPGKCRRTYVWCVARATPGIRSMRSL